MKRRRVCSFCLGDGSIEEFCPCCFENGLLPRADEACKGIAAIPWHDKVFNDTPRFVQLREKRASRTEFQPGKIPGFAFIGSQEELEAILGRAVDVTIPGGIHALVHEDVLQNAQTYHEQS